VRYGLVGGSPVWSRRDEPFRDGKYFYGGNVGFTPVQGLDISLYALEQRVDDLIDRRAVGSDLRYLSPNLSVFATLDYSHIGWLGGATALRATARHGLDVLNASDPRSDAMSRADADPEFTRLEFSLAHSQPLPRGLVLTLWAEGQYSFDPLPAAEEFAAGGPRFGRAYDLAEITGEHGVAAALELGYDLRPDRDWPQSSWIAGVTPYVFYDIARSWQKETAQTDGSSDSLASTGLGLRLVLVGGAELDLEYAYPLTRTPLSDTDKSGRVFAAFSARF